MKKIQRIYFVAAGIAVLFCIGPIFAQKSVSKVRPTNSQPSTERPSATQALVVENFDLTVGTLLTSSGFTSHSGAGTNAITVTAPGLTYTGYASSGIGNAVSMTTSGEDDNRPFPIQTSGSVYAALMVNVTDAFLEATSVGGYFFHLGPDPIGTTFRGRVFIRKDAQNAISFGITKASSTTLADINYTPFSYALNTTYLLVVKYTIVAGATNDTVDLFINPALGGAEPAATISATDVIASDINPGSFALRQGTATTHPTVRVDGIRISTSWASLFTPAPARVADFNGDGRTDYSVTRNPQGGLKTWWTATNGTAATLATQFGLSSDRDTPADYDGDGKADIAVWRENSGDPNKSYFYILQSSTGTFKAVQFGRQGDSSQIVGDYDGDGKADAAVFRPSGTAADPCGVGKSVWYYQPSATPATNFNYVCWGQTLDIPTGGDFDGDGKFDFCIFRNVSGAGVFFLRRSSDAGTETVTWGLPADAISPGDYDGDGKYDFAVARINGTTGAGEFYILERDGGGTGASPFIIGNITNDDELAVGDYDGDGRQDIGLFRGNATPGGSFFVVRKSSTGTFSFFTWGQQFDLPAADWNGTGGN